MRVDLRSNYLEYRDNLRLAVGAMNRLRYDECLELLEPVNDFYADTLRARTLVYTLRPAEARDHLNRGELLYRFSDIDRHCASAIRCYHFHRIVTFEYCVVEEILNPVAADTERLRWAAERAASVRRELSVRSLAATNYCIAVHWILRGRYHSALPILLHLSRLPIDHITGANAGYCLTAAACLLECRRPEAAQRIFRRGTRYCTSGVTDLSRKALFATRAAALLASWGREAEARRWRGILDRLNVPPSSRAAYHELGDALEHASRVRGRTVVF